MDEVIYSAIKEFGLRSNKIVKEKSYHICDTNIGVKVIKKSMSNPRGIIFQNDIKEHLYSSGFLFTDRFTVAPNGLPYVKLDEELYVMMDLLDYKETDFGNKAEFEKALKNCAIMHEILKETSFNYFVPKNENDSSINIKKNHDDMLSIKKQIGARKRLSDFDVMFFKNYSYTLENLDAAEQLLKKNEYDTMRKDALLKNQICHNLLKEENILQDNESVYVTNFSEASVDSQLNDISSMIRRYIRNRKDKSLDIFDIIEVYSRFNKLDDRSIRIILGLLKYPYNFLKLCGQFYSKKRTWTPNALINRMEILVSSFSEYEEFIKPLEKI